MILERARHDLGGRGRAAVDQHDDRFVFGEVAGARIEPLSFFGGAAARRYDLALFQERKRLLRPDQCQDPEALQKGTTSALSALPSSASRPRKI
jgi:hypothetical protein